MDPQLFSLLRGLFALVPPNRLEFPGNISLARLNDFFVANILLYPHFQSFPPSQQYQKRFWKWAIENLEAAGRRLPEVEDDEIDGQIYEHYLALDSSTGPSGMGGGKLSLHGLPPSKSYITHFWKLDGSLHEPTSCAPINLGDYCTTTLLENRTTIESGTTGLRTWQASFILAQYLILNPEIMYSRKVLEFGSGIGFLGTIIATLQHRSSGAPDPSQVSLWLTDVNEEVLQRCRENMNLACNPASRHPLVHYMMIDWTECSNPEGSSAFSKLLEQTVQPNVLLGADVVFDPSLIPSLVGTIKLGLKGGANFALIALTVRNEETLALFLARVQDDSLHVEVLEVGFERTSFDESLETKGLRETVKIFRITM